MKSKRGVATIFIVISLMAGLLTIFGALGVLDVGVITGSGSYIERPVFYYDKCEQVGSLSYSASSIVAKDGQWLNKPSVSDGYDAIIDIKDECAGFSSYVEYYVCNSKVLSESNCRIYSQSEKVSEGQKFIIRGVRNNEYVWAQFQVSRTGFDVSACQGAEYQVAFQPYGIRQYNILGGSSNQINPNSCTYPSTKTDTIISEDIDKLSRPEGRSTDERVMQPNEVRWYVAGYLTSRGSSFELNYDGEDAWCRPTGSGAEIYKINEIRTTSGTYKVASVDWSDKIGTEKCCPTAIQGDQVCNEDFEWERIAGSECSIFKSCGSPNWVPSGSGELIKYSCDDGFCVSETQEVECVSDFDCRDSNEVCDLNSYTCEKANVNLDGQVIETIPDSEAECLDKGGKWISKSTEDQSILNFVGIGEPDIIVTEYCEMPSGTNYMMLIVILLMLLAAFYFWPQIYSFTKMLLGKFGVKI